MKNTIQLYYLSIYLCGCEVSQYIVAERTTHCRVHDTDMEEVT